MPYNEKLKTIYAQRNRERYEYGLNGKLITRKKGPAEVRYFININDTTFASFFDNSMGNKTRKIVIFNANNTIIKTFPNYQFFEFKGIFDIFYPDSWFYFLDNNINFFEKFNDTVFCVTANSLIPRFVIEKGEYSFPYKLRGEMLDYEEKYFLSQNIIESTRFLFYSFSFQRMIYTALYDKKRQTTIVNVNFNSIIYHHFS